jgi:hypothetical protein
MLVLSSVLSSDGSSGIAEEGHRLAKGRMMPKTSTIAGMTKGSSVMNSTDTRHLRHAQVDPERRRHNQRQAGEDGEGGDQAGKEKGLQETRVGKSRFVGGKAEAPRVFCSEKTKVPKSGKMK